MVTVVGAGAARGGVVVSVPVTGEPMTSVPTPGGAGIGLPVASATVTVMVSVPSAKPVVSSVAQVDRRQRSCRVSESRDRVGWR